MTNYAISTTEDKENRKVKVNEFVNKFGRGDVGLTDEQKNERIKKVLGPEIEKLKGFGEDKNSGVELFTKASAISKPKFIDGIGAVDQLPSEVRDQLGEYPDDPCELSEIKKNKLLNIVIRDNGGLEIDGIVLDGKELDVKERKTWGISSMSDQALAKLEIKQKEKGELKEVSDRTMIIHETNGDLDPLLEHPDINTNEDSEMQY